MSGITERKGADGIEISVITSVRHPRRSSETIPNLAFTVPIPVNE